MISDWLRRARGGGREGLQSQGEVWEIPVDAISPNPFQPRVNFEEEPLKELAESIREVGVIEPVLVRPVSQSDSQYELVVGERRLRASQIVGLAVIPALIRHVSDQQMAMLGLVENMQREDLHPLEEASAYQRLINDFGLTQGDLAQSLSVSQSGISNKLRLLRLDQSLQEKILAAKLSERHARSLLRLRELESQHRVLDRVIEEQLSVRETDDLVTMVLDDTPEQPRKGRERGQMRGVIRDFRIFLNGLRQAAESMRESGYEVELEETTAGEGYRVTIDVRPAQTASNNEQRPNRNVGKRR